MKTKSRLYLSVLLIIAIFIPTQIVFATPSSDTVNFRLQADTGWVDSGFELQSGQQVTITTHG